MKTSSVGHLLILFTTYLAAIAVAPLRGAEFEYPLSAAVDKDGVIYVADRNLPGIWKVVDGKADVYFQASKKFRTPLNAVWCVAIDEQGRLLAGDSATREVYRFDEPGKPVPLTDGGIGIAKSIAVAADGTLYVADQEIGRIWKVPADGRKPEEFAHIAGARGVGIDADGRVWVVAGGKRQLVRLSEDGKSAETIVHEPAFQFPHNVVFDEEGSAYVSDGYAKTIWKISGDAEPVKWVSGEPLVNPVGLAWKEEQLLIVDPRANNVFAVVPDGKLTPLFSESE